MPKSKKPPLQTRQPGDSKAFSNANDMLEALGVRYRRPSATHLKIGKINYFPVSGKTHIDGHSKSQSRRGLEALKELLLDQRMKLGVYIAKRAVTVEKRDLEQRDHDEALAEAGDPNRTLVDAARRVEAAVSKARRA